MAFVKRFTIPTEERSFQNWKANMVHVETFNIFAISIGTTVKFKSFKLLTDC